MKKLIEMKRSGPADGAWRAPGWRGEVLDSEADALVQMGKADFVTAAPPPAAAPAPSPKPEPNAKGKASNEPRA